MLQDVLTKPSGVTSVEARPPGISLESTISHEGPSLDCSASLMEKDQKQKATNDLIEALCCSQTCGTGADNQDINVAVSNVLAG